MREYIHKILADTVRSYTNRGTCRGAGMRDHFPDFTANSVRRTPTEEPVGAQACAIIFSGILVDTVRSYTNRRTCRSADMRDHIFRNYHGQRPSLPNRGAGRNAGMREYFYSFRDVYGN